MRQAPLSLASLRGRSPSSLWLTFALVGAASLAACGSEESSGDTPTSPSGAVGKGSAGKGGASAGGSSTGSAGQGASSGNTSAGSGGVGPAGGASAAGQSGAAGAGAQGGNAQGGNGQAGDGQGGGGTGGSGQAGNGQSGTGQSGAGQGGSGQAGTGQGGSGQGASSGNTQAGSGGSGPATLQVQPEPLQTLTVPIGAKAPTLTYDASLGSQPVSAGWSIDRGNIGLVDPGPSSTTTLTPTGTTGGLVTVKAGYLGQLVERKVLVKLTGDQNGADPTKPGESAQLPTSVTQLTSGGGVGGVGGEGLGPAVTDPALQAALAAPAGDGADQKLRLLYPYDKTVWPRGMLAPLLMWDWTLADADAISIGLATTSGSFSWKGTFARPEILQQTGGAFVRHPIPQDIWQIATDTAGGPTPDGQPDRLVVSLTVAKGGKAYGPVTETWSVAPGRLGGIIYYQSYGTNLAKNYPGAVGGDGKFGGAVLSIKVGDTAPKLVAGTDGPESGCRVCHSVSANGSKLWTRRGSSGASSLYDLTPQGATEADAPATADFPALSPDGSLALTPSGLVVPLAGGGAPAPGKGLVEFASSLGTPAFSPDGKRVVFNPMAGPGLANPTQSLVTIDRDPATGVFSGPIVVADFTGLPATTRPGWPAFFPDSKSVVFQVQTAAGADGNADGALYTRKGARGRIAWVSPDTAGAVVELDALNGADGAGGTYLPKLDAPLSIGCSGDGVPVGQIDADHANDRDLNYEPTVNPIATGGYAWVVFTSRRMYGNVATLPPFCSDPRGVDLVSNITPKKLWVAAVDLDAQAGLDASHPAFYLPAQELLAGNARGFWVLDPCRPDGDGCASGDQCCNGFCQPDSSGALVCANTSPNGSCSQTQEKCASSADCCDATNSCIGGFCAQSKP